MVILFPFSILDRSRILKYPCFNVIAVYVLLLLTIFIYVSVVDLAKADEVSRSF
jgi:hypothetical protein